MRHQPLDEVVAEFGVGLHGKGAVAIDQRGIGAKGVMGGDLGLLGRGDYLILMPGVQGYGLAPEIIVLRAHRPAGRVLADLPAKRLRDDLVPETDADQRHMFGHGPANEILKRSDEGVILIHPVARSGDQPAVGIMDGCGQIHRLDVVAGEIEAAPGQQPLEHIVVIAVFGADFAGRLPGLEDADAHRGLS